MAEVLSEQIATKHDINELRAELREVEQRLVIKLGGMIVAAVALVAWCACFEGSSMGRRTLGVMSRHRKTSSSKQQRPSAALPFPSTKDDALGSDNVPWTLADLVAPITPDNCHDETDRGVPVGKENW